MTFQKGEKKVISAVVTPADDNELLIISTATYDIYDRNGTSVKSGNLEVDGNEISLLYEANTEGYFTLKITVVVGKETIIEKESLIVEG